MLYIVKSHKTLEETGKAFEQAIVEKNFSILGVHDLKEKINKKGLAFNPECRVYEVCNPQKAQAVLKANLEISTALPCRVSMYTEGLTVKLATLKPTEVLKMFAQPGLEDVAKEIEEVIVAAMETAAE